MARLNREQIAASALSVIDEKGLAGFTIRSVADALAVSPMAIYYHVKDKAELAGLVVSAAIREVSPAPPTGAWRDDMLEIARWSRDYVTRHPAVGELHRVYPVITPEIVKTAERWVNLWQHSGLDRKTAKRAAHVSSIAIASLVVYVSKFLQVGSPSRRPASSKSRAAFLSHDIEDLYELAFAYIIDGLHANLGKQRLKGPQSRRRSTDP